MATIDERIAVVRTAYCRYLNNDEEAFYKAAKADDSEFGRLLAAQPMEAFTPEGIEVSNAHEVPTHDGTMLVATMDIGDDEAGPATVLAAFREDELVGLGFWFDRTFTDCLLA